MGILRRESPWAKEYRAAWQQEQKFLEKYGGRPAVSRLDRALDEKIPAGLRETLHKAFVKAFQVVFAKGDSVIRKTVRTNKRQQEYIIRQYNVDKKESRKNLRKFHKAASGAGRGSVALSSAAGIGMGAFGVALPDIPLFTAMLLKCVYETADTYGYAIGTDREKVLALRIIEAALSDGEILEMNNREIDGYFQNGYWIRELTLEEQIRSTARQLSEAMIYSKFLQNIPVAGVVGGAKDGIYLRRVQQYAAIKYRKRFLLHRKAGT